MGLAASRQEAFWEACGFGHILRVKKFLEAGDIDVNWVSYTHDCCPIHVASQGKTEIVRLLIEAKCNVNVQDIRGNTPLHHAAMKGHGDIIKILVEAGAEVNVQDKNDWTALHCACYWNHSKAVRVLLNLGADITLQNKDKRTALLETARSQEKDDESLGEITHMLISAGSDLNCKGCSDLGDLEADFTGLCMQPTITILMLPVHSLKEAVRLMHMDLIYGQHSTGQQTGDTKKWCIFY